MAFRRKAISTDVFIRPFVRVVCMYPKSVCHNCSMVSHCHNLLGLVYFCTKEKLMVTFYWKNSLMPSISVILGIKNMWMTYQFVQSPEQLFQRFPPGLIAFNINRGFKFFDPGPWRTSFYYSLSLFKNNLAHLLEIRVLYFWLLKPFF